MSGGGNGGWRKACFAASFVWVEGYYQLQNCWQREKRPAPRHHRNLLELKLLLFRLGDGMRAPMNQISCEVAVPETQEDSMIKQIMWFSRCFVCAKYSATLCNHTQNHLVRVGSASSLPGHTHTVAFELSIQDCHGARGLLVRTIANQRPGTRIPTGERQMVGVVTHRCQ